MQMISAMIVAPVMSLLFASLAVEAEQASPVAQLAAEGAQASSDVHLNTVAGALTDLLKSGDQGAGTLSAIAQASNTSAIVETIKELLNGTMKLSSRVGNLLPFRGILIPMTSHRFTLNSPRLLDT